MSLEMPGMDRVASLESELAAARQQLKDTDEARLAMVMAANESAKEADELEKQLAASQERERKVEQKLKDAEEREQLERVRADENWHALERIKARLKASQASAEESR